MNFANVVGMRRHGCLAVSVVSIPVTSNFAVGQVTTEDELTAVGLGDQYVVAMHGKFCLV